MHISEKCFVVCKCEPCVICSCLLSLLNPMRTALHACICKCVFSLSLSVSLSACLFWPLQPFPSHPSLQSPCEIWSSNCPAWTPHSFHGPAYRHCVTLTTANYHCDGELSLTLALWEYRYISLNKSAQLHTHTHSCTAGFSTSLHLALDLSLSWSICLKERERGCIKAGIIAQHKRPDCHTRAVSDGRHVMSTNKDSS